jgi:hypothetical protein
MQSGHAQKRAWNKDKNTTDTHKCSRGAGFCLPSAVFHRRVTIAQQPSDGCTKSTAERAWNLAKIFARKCERRMAA